MSDDDMMTCTACQGRGTTRGETCPVCMGTGQIKRR